MVEKQRLDLKNGIMITQFDIDKLLKKGVIDSELELEQAFSVDKKLRDVIAVMVQMSEFQIM